MTSLADLYVHYCRRTEVKPNSGFLQKLNEAFRLNGGKRDIAAVDLSQNYVGSSGLVPITDLIRNTPSIQSVNLSNCFLEHEQLETVLNGLSLHPSLSTLILRSNSLHDSSLHTILDFLRRNPRITNLDVSGNDFLLSSVSAINAQLEENRLSSRTQESLSKESQINAVVPAAASTNTTIAADGTRIASGKENAHVVAVRSHFCEVSGRVSPEQSGGHMHFATWRANRQFALRLGQETLSPDGSTSADAVRNAEQRLSEVRLEMNVTDDVLDSRLVGFVVFKGNGVSRVVHAAPDAQKLIVGESALHSSYCVADVRVDCDEVYHIMPFSMQPGRGFSFTLSAEAIARSSNVHTGAKDRSFVALAPLDPRYDWLEAAHEDAWVEPSDNGGGLEHVETWRRSIAYRVNLRDGQNGKDGCEAAANGSASSDGSAADAQLHVVIEMITCADPDASDDRRIGFQVVLEDPSNPGHPPLCPEAEHVLWSQPHTRTNSLVVECTFRRGDLSRCFIFPNTETPGQCGSYSLRIYATTHVRLERSMYPHGWWRKTLCGAWTDHMCGGPPLGPSKSWRYNPSYEVESPEGGAALRAFLCMDTVDRTHNAATTVNESCSGEDVCGAEKQKMEVALYFESHRSENGGGGALLLTNAETLVNEYAPPLDAYTVTEFVLHENSLASGRQVLLVPHTRFPGHVGTFSLEILSSAPLLLDTEPLSIAERYRTKCLDEHHKATQLRHATLNEERALVNQHVEIGNGGGGAGKRLQEDNQLRGEEGGSDAVRRSGQDSGPDLSEDLATRLETTWETTQAQDVMNSIFARKQYEDVARACRLSRLLHVDREFPRGCSSLCLDPNTCTPPGFPNVCSWKRPRDIILSSSTGDLPAPHPQGDAASRHVVFLPSSPDEEMWRLYPEHQWLQSAVSVVACKPRWIGDVSLGYDQELGVAQFRFFKSGQWIPVTVDDFLPVDEHGDLCFGEVRTAPPSHHGAQQDPHTEKVHDASGWVGTATRRENINFFYPLLAKAYAKLHRCYQALDISLSSGDTEQVDDAVLVRTLQEGLADLTGSVTSVKSLQSNESDSLSVARTSGSLPTTRKSREQDAWNRLKQSSNPQCVVSLLLTNSSRNAAQLKRQGISTNVLYAVIGTHRVGGYDLVHIKEWRQPYEETQWNGRFGRNSTLWTPELCALLRPDLEPASLWMTLSEVMISFTDVFVSTKAESAVLWVPLSEAGEVADADDSLLWWEKSPQFSLAVSHRASPSEGSAVSSAVACVDDANSTAHELLTVTVGLHQPDLRMGLIRSTDARVDYVTGTQLAVLLSDNNRRRISTSNEGSPIDVYEGPLEYRRDAYVTFPIPLSRTTSSSSSSEISIASLVTHAVKLRGSCVLSVRCNSHAVNVSLTPIASATNRTVVAGKWRTHGGLTDSSPANRCWRDNPQYCLLPSAAGDCSITLRLASHPAFGGSAAQSTAANAPLPPSCAEIFPDGLYLGFTVLKSTSTRSLMYYAPEDVVFSTSSTSPNGVQGNVWLSGASKRCGLPYIVVPHYVYGVACNGKPIATADLGVLPPEMYFELEVKSLAPHSLASFNSQLDWRRATFASHLSLSLGNAGGPTRYSSWRNNPQYLITSVLEGSGSVLVSVRHRSSTIRQVPVGVALLACDGHPRGYADATPGMSTRQESLSRCRKLVLRDDSVSASFSEVSNKTFSNVEVGVLADSGLCESFAEVEYAFPKRQGGNAGCVLMLYTAEPFQEALVQVSVYTSMDVHIQPVREWSTVTTIDGSWKLGNTTGGSRALNAATWLNNPFVALIVSRPTLVTLVLLQCPSGPTKNTAVCVNKKRLALPFPTQHANHKRIAIGLDLVRGDKAFTPVQSTRHVHSGEVSLTCFLCPFSSHNLPYYVIPHTMNAEENCEFKLLVYSDQNIGVLSVDKPRHEWN